MTRRRLLLLPVLAVLLASLHPAPADVRAQVNLPRLKPNLIFILTDDQRLDQMSVMPHTIREFPVEFTQAIVATPLCCPSRASYLTGEYPHNHRVWTNFDYPKFKAREANSLGPWLQGEGYFTGFVGRYLNRYRTGDPTPPGWNEFYSRVGDGKGQLLHNGYTKADIREYFPEGLGSQTRIARYPDEERPRFYSTDFFADTAVEFIRRAESLTYNPTHKPWALVVWPNAPHLPLIPADRHERSPVPPFDPPPSFLEPSMGDKPIEVREPTYRNLNPLFHAKAHRQMLRMLMSVDDLVRRVWDAVDERGLRSNTYGVFASDNGWFLGEHQKMEKVYAYEEAAHVPFRMAIPGASPVSIDALVQNIDLAPTLMDLAGDTSSHGFRGRSLMPLVEDPTIDWRDAVLIEARSRLQYDAVRTHRWKYIQWTSGNIELYDLDADPYELTNVASRFPSTVAELRQELERLTAA